MNGNRKYLRFSFLDRIEHWLLTLSFTTLGITGLAQKFASGWSAQWTIETLGGIESVRIIHRVAAIVMMLETVYHIGVIGYRLFVRRDRMSILPIQRDIRVGLHMLMYNLGLRDEHPQQGRYTFEEKLEYWALVWGTLVMTVTGFMLWNPIVTARIFPGEFIPAAKAAHGGEAVLAVLAIIIWHFYQVHLKHFNKSMFTGFLSEKEMLKEHPLELAEIKAGVAQQRLSPQALARPRQLFLLGFGIAAVCMVVGIYYMATLEETAITTLPPAEQAVVYVPLTPTPLPTPLPTPTPRPTSTPHPTPEPDVRLSWSDGPADIFDQQCSACHSAAAKLGDLDLSTYQGLMAGGSSGPVIEPGAPDASRLVELLASGEHPGQLNTDELNRVRLWIEDGALETFVPEPTPEEDATTEPGVLTWADGPAEVFAQKCAACHAGAVILGELNLSSYEGLMQGGSSGPAIEPGDPEASLLITLLSAGDHPGQLNADELDQIRQWIEDGALETFVPEPVSETDATTEQGALTWADGLAEVFAQKCAACHAGAVILGELDLSTYEGLMQGGTSGPALEPGDPEASLLITLLSAGDHPGQLSAEELDQVRQWIEVGAPQE